MKNSPLLVRAYRGDLPESEHLCHLVAVDRRGKILCAYGDSNMRVYLRSAAKPVQAVPLIEENLQKVFGFADTELALTCASHNGEAVHVAAAASMLRKIGLEPDHLQCGIHRPLGVDLGRVPESSPYSALQNNCSGKHSGMLAACVHHQWPLESYLHPEHPHQRRIRRRVAEYAQYREQKIGIGVDGCSAPVFNLPLRNLAQMYANLTDPSLPGRRCFDLMAANPEMVAGSGRFDTAFMKSMHGKVIAKTGAEGLECLALLEPEPIGIALKIADGNKRAVPPAILSLLRRLELIPQTALEELQAFIEPVITNHRGIKVGKIACMEI